MTKDEICKRWRGYFKDMVREDGVRDVGIVSVGPEVKRVRRRYGREVDTIKEEMNKTVTHLIAKKRERIKLLLKGSAKRIWQHTQVFV